MATQKDRVQETVKAVEDMEKVHTEKVRDEFEAWGYGGLSRVSDEDFLLLFEAKLAESPPVPMLLADGRQVEASPFLMALAHVEGGNAELRRYERILGLRER